jgi:hypothetical protein
MVRLAFAIAFLAVFGMVAVWVVSYLERNYWKKDSSNKEENKNETKQENKTN